MVREALSAEPDMEVVGEAGNGRKCLELVERERPHVLVTDLAMPECNGFEVLEGVRRRGLETRVIMLSGFSAQRVGGAARALGAVRYLEKSATLDDIKRADRDAAQV